MSVSGLPWASLAALAVLNGWAAGYSDYSTNSAGAFATGYADYSMGSTSALAEGSGDTATQVAWGTTEMGTDLEAAVARTSRVAAFLAQDAQTLSEQLRGLGLALRRQRQRPPPPVAASGAGQAAVTPQEAIWPPQATVPAAAPVLLASPPPPSALLAPGPARLTGAAHQATAGPDVVGPLSYEANPEVEPSLSALQTSMGNTDDMLAQAEADPLRPKGSAATSGASVGTEQVLVAAPQGPALMLNNSTSTGSKCGGEDEVPCNGFFKVYTLNYTFTIFWSSVHWAAILMMLCLCCCCCRICLRRR